MQVGDEVKLASGCGRAGRIGDRKALEERNGLGILTGFAGTPLLVVGNETV